MIAVEDDLVSALGYARFLSIDRAMAWRIIKQ
jgi:hypothetical protein